MDRRGIERIEIGQVNVGEQLIARVGRVGTR